MSSCSFLTPDDKKFLSRARLVSALDEEMNLLVLDDDNKINNLNDIDSVDDPSSSSIVPYSEANLNASAYRVTTCPSPYVNVFFNHITIKIVIDTGATINMVHQSTARNLGLVISPSSQSATQADGNSKIDIVGETRFSVTRNNKTLHFEGLVARSMDTEVLAGIPFLVQNNISVHPAKNIIMIDEDIYPYGSGPSKPSVKRIQTSIARSSATYNSIWPGEFFEATCEIDPNTDLDVAVEPHSTSPFPIKPMVTKSLKGSLRFMNDTNFPIKIKKNQHVAHVNRVIDPDCTPQPSPPDQPPKSQNDPPDLSSISINPDRKEEYIPWESKFSELHKKFAHVFSNHLPGYNGHAGPVTATVNMSNSLPPQRKGRCPQYCRDKLVDLQNVIDDLEIVGVFRRPEDVNVNVEYVNPSFLIKKKNGYRLVTSFGEVAKHSKPSPSLMPDVDSTLRQIGQWKYIIKTDLTKSYFQIPLSHSSQKYCGIVTPFRGIRVYQRCAMGMPGSESALEELMSRILGDLIVAGNVAKIADDLYCGANSLHDLISIWTKVLQLLSDCDIRLSAPKTVILPISTQILGWIWSQGSLRASPHQISPLAHCDPPRTVKALRSFIGAFKALSRVIENCSQLMSPLSSLTGGRSSSESISWSETLLSHFEKAKSCLKSTKIIFIPRREDQLWIVTDGSVKSPGIGSTLYITRPGEKSPLLGGFFSAKLKKHQPRWLPCEIEALSISSACNHFRPYIIQSSLQTKVLTDSSPCVQAYKKLTRGEFSASARVQTFLTIVTHLNVSVNHISGTRNLVADFASRNAPDCFDTHCQICKFNNSIEETVVFKVSTSIPSTNSLFTNRVAWRDIQSNCQSISKCKEHLAYGTSPSKKCNKSTDIKRYLRSTSLAKDGLLVVKSTGSPWISPSEKIVVPRFTIQGILTALHLKSDHPTPSQLKLLFNRSFFALDIDKQVETNCSTCHTCASIKQLPKHIGEFSTSDSPNYIGQNFSVDVLRRAGQTILITRESISSYTAATFIKSEKAEDLLEGLTTLIFPLHPPNGPKGTIRSDPSLGFQSLCNNQPWLDKNISFELGRFKNPNKNPIADKAIQELEKEIIRIVPSEKPLNTTQLNNAVSSLNSRIRANGLSSYEIMFRRNQITGEIMNNSDDSLISAKLNSRVNNHLSSQTSQQPKSTTKFYLNQPCLKKGDLVYLKNESSKHQTRYPYIILSIVENRVKIQKLINNQLRSRIYDVHISDCFSISKDTCPKENKASSSSHNKSTEDNISSRSDPTKRPPISNHCSHSPLLRSDPAKRPPISGHTPNFCTNLYKAPVSTRPTKDSNSHTLHSHSNAGTPLYGTRVFYRSDHSSKFHRRKQNGEVTTPGQ